MLYRWVLVGALVVALAVAPVAVTARETGNEAPLADAGLDQRVELGTTVLLDATGSRDPDGEIESYDWRIETPAGATIVPQCPTCGQSRFRPGSVGTYSVTITVTDDDGLTSTDTLYVTVEGSSTPTSNPKATPSPTASPATASPSNPIGVDPPSMTPSCTNAPCSNASGPEPWLDITGPSRVARGEEAGFVLEYGGFQQNPRFGWSIDANGVTGVEQWNAPGEKTIYVTAATDDRVARANHDIMVSVNQEPEVEIKSPSQIHSGQTITLTVDASDPDGYITSVDWTKGPKITVPEGDSIKTILVTVTDNDGQTSTDGLSLTGSSLRTLENPSSALHTLYCYYNQESERKRQNPDHCEMEGSDNSGDGDGYHSVTSNLDRVLRSSHFNVVWKKTDEDVSQHSGDLGDDVGVRMPDVVDNDGTTSTAPTLTDDQRDAITGDAVTTSTQSFTMEGKTVTNDLNGDGEVNAEDWDERFGSDDRSPADTHSDAVSESKDARRSTNRATGGGGPASSDSGESGATNDDSTGGSSDSGGSSDPLGGDLPDSLTDGSAGEHAAEKGSRIADEGLDLGVGY
ncbi:PKD domain-containing protein [Halorarius litoreus]|uniref:PKD domain-containing protein n=1 Tax=Halorarius litoreus TaxID=2962676 RepID=UPI0020CC5BC6|nr:PKD domain-containing protein [Halorarius litoreus]